MGGPGRLGRRSIASHKNITALSVEIAINWFAISSPTSSASTSCARLSPSQCVRASLRITVIAEDIALVNLVAGRLRRCRKIDY